jgi:DNA polymerase elongation subunit (family B)
MEEGDIFVTDISNYARVIYGRNPNNEPIAIKVNYDNRLDCLIWVFDQSRFTGFLNTFSNYIESSVQVFIKNDHIRWCGSKGFEFGDNFDSNGNVADLQEGIPYRLTLKSTRHTSFLKFIKTESYAYGFETVLCNAKEFIILIILCSLMEHVSDSQEIKNLRVIGTWLHYRIRTDSICVLNRDLTDPDRVEALNGVNNFLCWSPSAITATPKFTYLFYDIEAGSRWFLDYSAPLHSNGCSNQIIQMVALIVSEYNNEQKEYIERTMVIVNLEGAEFDYSQYDTEKYCFVENQLELIDVFMQCICQVDLIGGHNIIGYDNATILSWMLLLDSPWCKLYESTFNHLSNAFMDKWELNLPWQITLDSQLYYQRFVGSKCNSLNYLGDKMLNERKLDLGYKKMWELMFSFYNEGNAEALQTVIDYCIQDTKLSWRLVQDKLDMFMAFVHSCHLSLPEYMTTRSTVPHAKTKSIITALLLGSPFSARFQAGTNSIQSLVVDKPKDIYMGGYVFEPKKTVIVDKIQVQDFNSLYPSSCMYGNYAGPTCWAIDQKQWSQYVKQLPVKVQENILALQKGDNIYVSVKTNNAKQFGILKRLQIYFKEQRGEARRLMKLYDPKSSEYAFLDAKQLAEKLAGNGSYGLYAWSFEDYVYGIFKQPSSGSCFLRNIDTAACITAMGQELLKVITSFVEEKFGPVTYGDTDSIFVVSGDSTLDVAVNKYMKQYTGSEYIVSESEGMFDVLIQSKKKGQEVIAKKAYVLVNVETNAIKIRGMEKTNYMLEKEFKTLAIEMAKILHSQNLTEYCTRHVNNPHEMSTFRKVRMIKNPTTLIRSCMYYIPVAEFAVKQEIQYVKVVSNGSPAEVPIKFYNNQDPLYPELYISTLTKLLSAIGVTDSWCEQVFKVGVLDPFVQEKKKLLQHYQVKFISVISPAEKGCYYDKAIIESNYSSDILGGLNYTTCCQELCKCSRIDVTPTSWESVKLLTKLAVFNAGEEEPIRKLGIKLLRSMYSVKSVCIVSTQMNNGMSQLHYIYQLLLLNKCAKSANSLKEYFARQYVESVVVETPIGYLYTRENHIRLFKSITELLNHLAVK